MRVMRAPEPKVLLVWWGEKPSAAMSWNSFSTPITLVNEWPDVDAVQQLVAALSGVVRVRIMEKEFVASPYMRPMQIERKLKERGVPAYVENFHNVLVRRGRLEVRMIGEGEGLEYRWLP